MSTMALRLLAVVLVLAWLPGAPSARADSTWTSGACTDDQGVTVVVDHKALGGGVVVRCVPRWKATISAAGRRGSGLDALTLAGLPVTPPARFPGAVCRISNRPAANEQIAVKDNPTYRESCVSMPPAAAYWSYWHAPAGGSWTYSTSGADRLIQAGGFEGWAFQLNTCSSAAAKAPGVSPVRGAPRASQPPTTTAPRTTAPPPPARSATSRGVSRTSSVATTVTSSSSSAVGSPSPSSPPPSETAPPSGTPSPALDTRPPIPPDTGSPTSTASPASAGSRIGTLVGIGVIAAVAATGGGILLWRRRRG